MNISKLCTKQIFNLTLFKNIYCNKKIIFHHSNILKPYSVHSKTVLNNEESCSKYTNRTHTCGALRRTNIGEKVILCGWLEYQRMNKFIVLRDSYGRIQLLIKEEDLHTQKVLENIPFESILEVSGTVLSRPAEMINKNQPTGEIEVVINDFKVLNKAEENLPFNIREFQKAKEPLRMQYRYLDLRFSEMQRNLRYRSTLLMKMRKFLCNNDFVDVETPTLFKATPGGAQEFIVPTRFPGQFYSLVQSPQQFKQMLMAGAVDRYFQIARCYRDEGARSDRQPEFTQLDIEISFTNAEEVIKLIEDLLQYSITEELNSKKIEIKKMTYNEAMEEYGTDQPDLTFEYKIRNCTDILKKNASLVEHDDFGAFFLSFPKELSILNKKVKQTISNITNKFNNVKLVLNIIKNKEEWINKIGRLLTKEIATEFLNANGISEESTLFLAFGNKHEARSVIGKIRTEYVNFLESTGINVRRKELQFLWIIDFPLFELSEEGTLKSAHHPFTAPHPDDINLLRSDPLKVRGLSYDLVLNGYEVGGGSIRIHDPNLQLTILDILKINPNTMQHMLDMLGSGCPPHGGIALGLDRLLSVLLNTHSIRDVIAFPKNYEGRDPMSGAPSYISDDDKKLYHVRSIDKDKM